MSFRYTDMALGFGVALVWGFGIVFAKSAMDHFPPILLMALRFTVTSAALVWFARPHGGQLQQLLLISMISATLQYSLTFTGLAGLDASAAALIVQLEVPFLVLIGAVFLGEKPGGRKWFGIAIAFGGVYLIAGQPAMSQALFSVGLVVAGGVAWAAGQAMVRRLRDISGLTVAAWVAVLATPQLYIASFIFEENQLALIQTAPPLVWGVVIYLGLVMTALGYLMWYTLVRRVPVSQAAPYLLMLPVFAGLGGWFFLGEVITPRTFIGGAIILGGVALIVFERPPSKAPPV